MRKGSLLYTIAMILLIIGGLNWGLVGAFEFDLVAAILGAGSIASRVVYVLVGLSAIVVAIGCLSRGTEHSAAHGGTYGATGTTTGARTTTPRV